MSKLNLPTWLPNYKTMPALYHSGQLSKSPTGIVIHSGSHAPGIAEYFCSNQESRLRKVSAHFAWSTTYNTFAQCVPLDERACHVGFWVNRSHYGIEMPGPMNRKRPDKEYDDLIALINAIRELVPTVRELVAHSFLDPKNRADPGKDFEWERLINLGLRCKF